MCSFGRTGSDEVRVSGPSLPSSWSESAVKGGPTGPSEASRETAPLTAEERRLWPAVDRLLRVSQRGGPCEQQATTKSAELRAFRANRVSRRDGDETRWPAERGTDFRGRSALLPGIASARRRPRPTARRETRASSSCRSVTARCCASGECFQLATAVRQATTLWRLAVAQSPRDGVSWRMRRSLPVRWALRAEPTRRGTMVRMTTYGAARRQRVCIADADSASSDPATCLNLPRCSVLIISAGAARQPFSAPPGLAL